MLLDSSASGEVQPEEGHEPGEADQPNRWSLAQTKQEADAVEYQHAELPQEEEPGGVDPDSAPPARSPESSPPAEPTPVRPPVRTASPKEGVWRSLGGALCECCIQWHASLFNVYFQAAVTLFSCALFVWSTYYEDEGVPLWMDWLELLCVLIFVGDYVYSLWSAQSACRYARSTEGLIDLASILPVLRIFFLSSTFGFVQFVRLFKVLRVLRLHNLRTLQSQTQAAYGEEAARGRLFDLCFTIFSLLFISTGHLCCLGRAQWGAGLIHMLDHGFGQTFSYLNDGTTDPLEWLDALYFVIITFSTVGYGDIVPLGTSARLLCCVFVVLAFATVPRKVNSLAEALSKRSPYLGEFKLAPRVTHVVVTGNLTPTNVESLLDEIFSPCHTGDPRQAHQAVLLSPEEPSDKFLGVLGRHRCRQFITFLQGSPLVPHDLMRARADRAAAIFVLCDQNSSKDPQNEDARAIMRTTAIRRWSPAAGALLVTQLIHQQSVQHLTIDQTVGKSHSVTSCCVCADEMKLLLLAESCLNHGLSTLICNLLTSVQRFDADPSQEPRPSVPSWFRQDSWRLEYENGAANEIYQVSLEQWADQPNVMFHHAAAAIFEEQNTVLLGVVINDGTVLVNPAEHELEPEDTLLVISSSNRMAQRTAVWHNSLGEEQEDIHLGIKSIRAALELDANPPRSPKIDPLPEPEIDWQIELQEICGEVMAATAPSSRSAAVGRASVANALAAAATKMHDLAQRTAADLDEGEMGETDQHVVLVGPLHHAAFFIQSLLGSARKKKQKCLVTILHTDQPGLDTLRDKLLRDHPGSTLINGCVHLPDSRIRLVRGSPLVGSDLKDAGIASATSLVVLASPAELVEGHEYLVDSDAIMIAARLRSFFPGNLQMVFPHLIVELVWSSNICLLDNLVGDADASAWSGALFASGSIYSNTILNCLAAQAYYNPLILRVVSELLNPGMASMPLRHKLRQIQVPAHFVGKSYGTLFRCLVECKFIALGLYRMAGTNGSQNHYVCSNPDSSTMIVAGDHIYVVAPD